MKLFYYDIRSPLPSDWEDIISPERRSRATRYFHIEDRLRCLGAGILLAKELGVVSDNDIVYASNGKPELKNGAPQFNISHSGDFVVLAVSSRTIGVDIERIDAFDWAVARRCFTPEEQVWLRSQSCNEAFFRLWTGKEAVMKALGLGFMKDPASFTLLPAFDGVYRIDRRDWRINWLSFENYTVCTAEEDN